MQASDLYTIKILSIVCSDVDPTFIINVTCYIKAQRGKLGLINVRFKFQNVNYMMSHLQLFYRNSAGKFLPFLVDYTYDNCKFVEMAQAGAKVFSFINRLLPFDFKEFEACPLNVSYKNCLYEFS